MKAAVYETFGPPGVVRLANVPTPVPRSDEVLVRVEATPVTSADARIRAARFPRGFGIVSTVIFGRRRPRRAVLGGSFAGVIESAGSRVHGFASGQRVCGVTGLALGAHAEYLRVPATRLVQVPDEVSSVDAAGVIFGGTTAWYFLHDLAEIVVGSTVLVNGAGGAVGTNAVQLARLLGADVTAVCSSTNATLVRELGATAVIDHTRTEVAELCERFDVVLDTVGTLSLAQGRRLLTPGGRLLLVVADLADTLRARGDTRAGSAPDRISDITRLLGLVGSGELQVLIDGEFPLDRIVDAHLRVDSHRKVGNVIVRP